jgi:phenylacetate-CoA ligase
VRFYRPRHEGQENRAEIEALWDAPCHDMYGTNESGSMASECTHRTGMHIQEDAIILEVADPETGRIPPDGEKGTLYITTLYRWGAPQIRFNVNDISAIAKGECPCGSTLKRLEKIYGRNDNMVKLRGVNVFPEAIGAAIAEDKRSNGEYFCIVERVGEAGRDEMTVMVEVGKMDVDRGALKNDLEQRLREVLGVKVIVQPLDSGALGWHTGVATTSKIMRLLDKRK